MRFASLFGDLDDVTPYTALGKQHRLSTPYLFDVSNLLSDGTIAPLSSHRAAMNKGNTLFHVDSSFNPRRGSYSLLRAAALPPPGSGGETEFADSRTAFETLPGELREELLKQDYVAAHSLFHSRKLAAPEMLRDVGPEAYPMGRHRLVQRHEPSGRMNLYIASHVHHIEGLEPEASRRLFDTLYAHVQRPENTVRVEWRNDGDLVMWDNTCVLHRASPGGGYEGRFVRDMRRATVHDGSVHAWGLNETSDERQGYP